MSTVSYQTNPPLTDDALNDLFARAWPDHRARTFIPVLAASLAFVAAFVEHRLIGFVNIASDGGAHAFLLDPTVDAEHRRRGIGTTLVRIAADLARARGCEWLHVDYEPRLAAFYQRAGFVPSAAGVMHLDRTG